ncbi:MAG: DnaJ domain-containing protein [Promicromonosporaceae bacterium]|nr:DnaJ domain-containing protein [Promicromonosporaceae bacterium]
MTGQDWLAKDFYATLGVPKDADDAAIKKAYRKLARKYHPDQNPGDGQAETKFKEIGEAYAVISDAEQRKQYDAIRAMGSGGARFTAGGPGGFQDMFGGMFGGGGRTTFQTNTGDADINDLLAQMMGGGGGGFGGFGGGRGFQRPQRGADISAAYTLSFRDAVRGQEVELGLDGRKVKTRIPAGVADGKKLRIPGKGRPGVSGGEAGDLVLSVHVDKHPVFTMDGRNLRMNLPVSYLEAVQGAQVEVPTIDGDQVTVKVPAGTPSGRVLRVKGRGVPASGKKAAGDLLMTVQIAVPNKLTRKAKQALEAFAAELGDDNPRADLAIQAVR